MADSSMSNNNNRNNNVSRETTKGGWNAAIFIICVEIAMRFSYQAVPTNLIMFLTNILHEPTTVGVKNMNTWVGVSSLFPIIGAFIADSYVGRFRTILFAFLIYLMGIVIMILSVSALKNKALFFVGLYVLAIGDGIRKPCVQTFAADQFDENTPEEKHAKNSFFNWLFLGIVVGSTTSVLTVTYIQDKIGWGVGLGVLAVAMGIGVAVFVMGMKCYRKESPLGSPFTSVAQVFVAASRKWRLQNTCHGPYTLPPPQSHVLLPTHHFRILDKATMMDEEDISARTRDPWRLCSVTQVEEVKLVLRLIPIWLSCLMFAVVQSQSTFFTEQVSTTHHSIGNFELSPTFLIGFVGIITLLVVPVYDRLFVPFARRLFGHPSGITVLQRIGTGLLLSILNMVVSALIEAKRIHVAKQHGLLDNPSLLVPMSMWWLLPQYFLFGICDLFTIVGLQELYYDQMPEAMRSMGAAAHISLVGVGSFVSNIIISILEDITAKTESKWLGNNLNKAHLDYFYWVLAGLSGVSFCVYLWLAKGFEYKKAGLNSVESFRELQQIQEQEYPSSMDHE